MVRAIKRVAVLGVLAVVAAAASGCAYDGYGYYDEECGYELYEPYDPCYDEPAGGYYYEHVEVYDDCPY